MASQQKSKKQQTTTENKEQHTKNSKQQQHRKTSSSKHKQQLTNMTSNSDHGDIDVRSTAPALHKHREYGAQAQAQGSRDKKLKGLVGLQGSPPDVHNSKTFKKTGHPKISATPPKSYKNRLKSYKNNIKSYKNI